MIPRRLASPLRCVQMISSNQRTSLAKPAFTYCRYVRLLNTLKESELSELDRDINVEEIKESCSLNMRRLGGPRPKTAECIVREQLEKRYSAFIGGFDESQRKLLKVVQLEQNFLYSEGYAIPPTEKLSKRHWLEAMTLSTMEERLLYYVSLQRLFDSRKQVEPREITTSQPMEEDESRDSIFPPVLPLSREERSGNYRLATAMQFGEPMIIDLGFEESLLSTELEPLARQIWKMYLTNRSSLNPFHLVFVNCSPSNTLYRFLMLHYLIKTDFVLATFTEQSYTQMFPPHDCVYMSAQSRENLIKYDPNMVYVLGGYYDPLVRKKYSIAKAGQDGVRPMRLPIDEHVGWAHQAHKDLDLDRILQVFLCVKNGLSWKEAFLFSVPLLAKARS